MLRLYHVLLAALAIAVLTPFGIAKYALPNLPFNKSQNPTAKTTPVPSPTPTTATNTQPVTDNVWKSILGATSAPQGWKVAPCEGGAPMLCVFSNGKVLGTVEMAEYPIEKQPNFQKMLAQSGIPVNSKIDYQSPKYKTQLESALKLWVANYYDGLEKDRRGVYGSNTVFSPKLPQTAQVGQLQGLRYGFAGLKNKNEVQEEHLGYVAFDGKTLYVITTAFDAASETGKFERLADFRSFEPFLSPTVKSLKLPK